MVPPYVWNIVFAAVAVLALAYAVSSRLSRARYMREVERLAFHDILTELPNRMLFLDRASFAFAHAKRESTGVAVVFLDLDRFKLVNDSRGHRAGDDVLRIVAARLREHVREVDTIARMGGDEFTLIMPGIRTAADAEVIGEKLLRVFRRPLAVGREDLIVTASIGISLYPEQGIDAEALLTRADAAMYRVKQRGGDAVQVYTPSIEVNAAEELELEGRLRRAVAENRFVLHYQPRLDVARGNLVAFEALVRWNDPERGLIAPGEFIPTAEVTGLIIPIGEWVLRAACRQARVWHEQIATELLVSVNLSPRQFQHPDLVSTIRAALSESGLEPRFLELEIDESCVMRHAEGSMLILAGLKAIGVRVLVSHFGAGYSSLSYLRRFPIDGLKLDRSFLTGDGHERSLATAALVMARALQLQVIGEGVETEEAAQFLRAQQCDGMQGYLVSAPIPPQECERFLNEGAQVGSVA